MLQSYFANRAANSPLAPIVAACKRAFFALGVTSGVINVLTLTGSIFMMQVYDRVLGSQSLSTLAGLSVIAIAAYLFQGWLETMRGRILALVGEKIDNDLGPAIQAAGLKAAVGQPGGMQEAMQVQRDLDAIRTFVGGTGLVAAFDMPWIVLYVVVTTLLHPYFGLTTLLAALLLVWLTWKNEQKSKPLLKEANDLGIKRNLIADGIIRNSEVVVANGMIAAMAARLSDVQQKFLAAQRKATFVITSYGNAAKTIRMVLQSFVLGLGAYLAIKGQISSGAIIGASIMVARALAPIDQAINSWRPFIAAREGHERLTKLLGKAPPARELMTLPPPKSTFAVKELAVVAPGGTAFAVAGVTFSLTAGQATAVIGQSASGKSSLLRGIVGAWKLNRGLVEFDGTGPDQWPPDVLGKHLGYLPQDVQLFDGSIADNISRFDADSTPEKIQAAGVAAGLDAYIRATFPQTGYNTPLAAGGGNLSGGQRQRLGLARALYGDPFLVVLDEPNSNLDQPGREALARAIRGVKERGGIVIVTAHDHNILAECDRVLTLHLGQPEWFGPRDEVMKKWLAKHHPELSPHSPTGTPQPAKPANGHASNGQAPTPIKSLAPGQSVNLAQSSAQQAKPAANGAATNGTSTNGQGVPGNGNNGHAVGNGSSANGHNGTQAPQPPPFQPQTFSSGSAKIRTQAKGPNTTPLTQPKPPVSPPSNDDSSGDKS